MIKNIIFDLDGTLINSRKLIINALNLYLPLLKIPRLTPAQIDLFYSLGAKKYLVKSGVSALKQLMLIYLVGRYKTKNYQQISLYQDVESVLEKLNDNHHHLFIISSNSSAFIKKINSFQLKSINIDGFSSAGLFNKSKKINQMINKFDLKKADTIYIGDELRDIKAGKKLKIKTGAVLWGYSDKKILQRSHPDYIFSTPTDFLRID